MTAGAEAPIPHSQRVRLAEQIMEQASSPTAIDQGYNSTCNVATVEGRIFSRQPSEAARLITDVATTGKYISADGKIVDLGRVPGALDPDGESLASLNRPFDPLYREDIKVNGRRTYASQILETTAVNLKWANASTATPGDVILYEKHFSAVPNDTGERLVKYRANPDGTITRQELGKAPDIRDYELMEIHNQITGGTDKNFVIRGPGYTKAPPETVLQVHSEADLADVLEKMANEKQFPAIIMVDVHHPPFNRFMGDPNAGGNGGLHVVNIQGFYKTAEGKMMVEFSNQWGVESHHMGTNAVPVETLFEATKPPRRQP
jgi:hypothetical protein